MKKYLPILALFLSFHLSGQFAHEPVFPTLDGEDLRVALVDNYKTETVLTYSQARDTFMRNMDAVDNVLECVYTGYKVTLDPNDDPTTVAFAQDINTEHTYPRSKGAFENTNAYSDMHHLFPTRVNVNSDRGSFIFMDVEDNLTDKWYLDDDVRTSIPNSMIDDYSELLSGEGFEPREKHKGDVARAYFYFYTMYQDQADNAAPNFFELQRETMCNWHFQDAVDEKEWRRNMLISQYQDDKRNPFILDCRLARLYCGDIEGYCTTVSTSEQPQNNYVVHPNPAGERIFIKSEENGPEFYSILNITGQLVSSGYLEMDGNLISIDISSFDHGFYVIHLLDENKRQVGASKFIKN